MNSLQRWRAALASVLVCVSGAHAGRPLQTEDAGVLGRFECELEAASQRVRVAGATGTETGVGASCGLGFNSQVGLALSQSRADGSRARSAGVGGKTGLWKGKGDDAPALTLAWGLGSDRDDGQWRRGERFATLVASLNAGPGTVHLNLGHLREPGPGRQLTTWNLAYEHGGFDLGAVKVAPMAEVFGDDRRDLWWNLALRVTLLPEKLFVDGSYGRQTRADKARLVTAGLKFVF